MASFEDREKAHEAKWAHDRELGFKVQARRNKLFGLWAAEHLGLEGAAADAYAREVVRSDFAEPGEEDVFKKVSADLNAKGLKLSEHRVRKEMTRLLDVAREQVISEK
ncbi:MAG: DUF1476 domain-containing protein [Alphaproteobacteria bacterium]|nr:DUF1476 domain-containing protein [Alphaproteobacteria bacterium]